MNAAKSPVATEPGKKTRAKAAPQPPATPQKKPSSASRNLLVGVAIVSAGAAVASAVIAYQALEQSRLEYTESRPTTTLADTLVSAVLSDVDPVNRPGVKILEVTMLLQNLDELAASDCLTYWEPVNAQYRPVMYYPTIVEINAETWNVQPFSTHESYFTVELDPAEWGTLAYVDVWYECEDPNSVTLGAIVDIDLATGNFLTPDQVLSRPYPLSSEERGQYILAVPASSS